MFTTSRTDSPAVHMTTQNYFHNTVDATNLSTFNPTLTSMREVTLRTWVPSPRRNNPIIPHPNVMGMYLICHTYQFRQLNTMFKSIDFSTSKTLLDYDYLPTREFGALI